MKKSEILFTAIHVPVDFIVLVLAGITAYAIRFTGFTQGIRPVILDIPFHTFLYTVLGFAALWVIVFALSGLYEMGRHRTPAEELSKIFLACSTGALLVVLVFFFSLTLFSSRFIILASWVLAIVYVSIERGLMRFVLKLFYGRGIGTHRVLLIGSNDAQSLLVSELQKNKSWGYRVTSFTNELNEESLRTIEEQIKAHEIDEVMVTDLTIPRRFLERLIDASAEYHIIYKYFPGYLETQSTRLDVSTIGGLPVIEVKQTRLDGWGRVLKRLFDVAFSLVALIGIIPLGIFIAIAIKIDTRGPVFFKVVRIGVQGKPFKLLKFRSMIRDAHQMKKELLEHNERTDGPLFKITNDPRVTKVGKFLRGLSLDELPQVWNVIRGEMSWVGPRPHEPEEVAHYESSHRQLLNIKPGITGMAQISGRSSLSFEDEVKLDVYYIQDWSLMLDISILVKTPFVVLKREHAV